MEISLKKEEYRYLEKCFETGLEDSFTGDLSLPEYMPAILRIVKSTAEININSCRLVGERVTVDGDCELRMIYTAEDGCIYSFSQNQSLTRYAENECLTDAVEVTARCCVNFVNCRATSPKKAEIKAGIVINVSAFKNVLQNVSYLEEKYDIEERCCPVSACSLGCIKNKTFSMSDTVEIEDGTIAYLLGNSSYAVVTEIKKIGNKILIKGDAVTEVSYVSSDNKCDVKHISYAMPINQILEIDGMEERFFGNVILKINSCDVIVKNDSTGNGKALDIALGISADVTMWEKKDYFVITDAYSTKGKIELTKEKCVFLTDNEEITDTFSFNEKIDVSKIGVADVLCMSTQKCDTSLICENCEFTAKGSVKLSFILKNTAGETVTFEKMVDYCYKKKLSNEYKNGISVGDIVLCNSDCTVLNASQIEIKADMCVFVTAFNKTEYDAVSSICETGETKPCNSAITVYFPQNNEELWDIARRYNTTVNAIAEENGIEGETTEGRRMIFIPTV